MRTSTGRAVTGGPAATAWRSACAGRRGAAGMPRRV